MDVQGCNVVVTGASQGIGEQLAIRFADAGANVVVVARTVDKLEALAARISGHAVPADLTDPDQVDGLLGRCVEEVGHVDVWVNNAGVETHDAFIRVDRAELRELVRLNVEATMMLTRDVAAHMVGRGSGHIVQMSSVAGTVPFPGLTAYAGTKAAVTHFTESLRVELAGTGVGLTVVAPGPVDTAMWERLAAENDSYQAPALRRFEQLFFLPKVDPGAVADSTVRAVVKGKPHVRLPARYAAYHALNNAPRRLVAAALIGVELDTHAPEPEDAAPWEPIWPTDNPPSRRWPLYTRGNVGEVFPEVVLPLTWDMFGKRAEDGWRAAFRRMGLLVDGDMPDDEPMVILSVFGGYCYIDASYVRLLGVRAPGGTVAAIDTQFFGESDAPTYRARPGDRSRTSTMRLGRTVLKLLNTKRVAGLDDDKRAVDAYVAAYPGDDASDAALLDYLHELPPLFEHLFSRHIENTFSVALLSGALADLLVKVDRIDQLVSVLGGIGEVESAAPSAAMWALARSAADDPAVAAAFDAGVDGLAVRLAADANGSRWLDRFRDFLAEFGSRGPNEWDIGSDPWAFRPEVALVAIDRMRSAAPEHAPEVQAAKLRARRESATRDVRRSLNRIDRFQFDKALAATTVYSQARERSKTTVILAVQGARRAQAELARRIERAGGPTERWKTCLLDAEQLARCVADPTEFAELIEQRAAQHAELSALVPPFIVDGVVPDPSTWARRERTGATLVAGDVLQGIAGCPGIAKGTARIVLDPATPGDLGPGDVLVAPITDPSWTPLFLAAEAVVVDVGATMSHAVIVSRELGIPCVVSAVGATGRIPDGATVEVDGNTGTVTVVELP